MFWLKIPAGVATDTAFCQKYQILWCNKHNWSMPPGPLKVIPGYHAEVETLCSFYTNNQCWFTFSSLKDVEMQSRTSVSRSTIMKVNDNMVTHTYVNAPAAYSNVDSQHFELCLVELNKPRLEHVSSYGSQTFINAKPLNQSATLGCNAPSIARSSRAIRHVHLHAGSMETAT